MVVRQWNCERNQSNFGPRDTRRPIRSVDRRIPFSERSKVHWTWNNNKVVKCWRELVRGWSCSIIIKPWWTPSLYSTLLYTALHLTVKDFPHCATPDAHWLLFLLLLLLLLRRLSSRGPEKIGGSAHAERVETKKNKSKRLSLNDTTEQQQVAEGPFSSSSSSSTSLNSFFTPPTTCGNIKWR